MYLAQEIEYAVQIGRALSIYFERLFLLTGFRASESGVDCRILSVVAVDTAFVFFTTRPTIAVLAVRTARTFAEVVTAS